MIPAERATPVGLNYEDFVPGGPDPFGGKIKPPEPSIEELEKQVDDNRQWVMGILHNRFNRVQSLLGLWRADDVAGCIMLLLSERDAALLSDFLKAAPLMSGGRVTMEHVCSLLPAVTEMLGNSCEEYALAAVKSIKAMLQSFGPVIASTRAVSVGSGVDIAREERIKRAAVASDLIIAALPVVQDLGRRGGLLGWHATQLQSAVETFIVGTYDD